MNDGQGAAAARRAHAGRHRCDCRGAALCRHACGGRHLHAATWVWTGVFAAVTLAVGRRGTPRLARLFQQFLAVELCLTALDALRSLDWLALTAPGVVTDATTAAGATHLPALVWAALWSIIGLAIVGLAALHRVRRSLRAEARRSRQPGLSQVARFD